MKISSSMPILCFHLFLSLVFTTQCASPKCNAQDKNALLRVKAALRNPGFLNHWSPNGDCCTWFEVRCNDVAGRVIDLVFEDQTISGQIPAAVTDLPYLRYLGFSRTKNLSGKIPCFLAKITHLQILALGSNKLSGSVPPFLSQIKTLTSLDLSFNALTGSIPPSLSHLPNLEDLYLCGNKLTGSIPESFGHWPGKTPNLILSYNHLTGTVPKSLGSLNLSRGVIDLSSNQLQGDPSFLFGKNKTASLVNISSNAFEFDLSKVRFPETLSMLDLSHNKIYGSIPRGLAQLELAYHYFNVSYNRLCGAIPQGGSLQRFDKYSYIHNRCLCGAPLPPCKS